MNLGSFTSLHLHGKKSQNQSERLEKGERMRDLIGVTFIGNIPSRMSIPNDAKHRHLFSRYGASRSGEDTRLCLLALLQEGDLDLAPMRML
jgi:hypothetical protein